MEIGIVGLGKMGAGLSRRLLAAGHRVVGHDLDESARRELASAGGEAAAGLGELVAALTPPRAVWVMVPAGKITEAVVGELAALLAPGDVVADGGNSNFHDTLRRARELQGRGLELLDVGTSGGIWGEAEGYCLMIGGDRDAVARLAPVFDALVVPGGWLHCGPSGSGHYVKMVHNGIEYGLMQAYAEGFELFEASPFELDKAAVAKLWGHGSVVRSWLLELAAEALEENPGLEGLAPRVSDSGEGRWTVIDGIERGVPLPVITAAVQVRLASQQENSYGRRFLNLLRNKFGGHEVLRKPSG